MNQLSTVVHSNPRMTLTDANGTSAVRTAKADPAIEAGSAMRIMRYGRTALYKRTKRLLFKAGSDEPAYLKLPAGRRGPD